MKNIERALSQFKGFLGKNAEAVQNEVTKRAFEQVETQILKDNEFNIEAQIQISTFDKDVLDISGYVAFQTDSDEPCYEVNTYDQLKDSEGNTFDDEREAKEHFEEEFKRRHHINKEYVVTDIEGDSVWGQHDTLNEALEYVQRLGESEFEEGVAIKPFFTVVDDCGDIQGTDTGHETQDDAEDELQEMADEDAEEKVSELEKVQAEVMINYVRRYNGYVNQELAEKCGLNVITVYDKDYDGEQFIAFNGAGMDMTPQLVAYKALEHKAVAQSDIHHFVTKGGREYFQSLVGELVATEVYQVLGIWEAITHEMNKEITPKF